MIHRHALAAALCLTIGACDGGGDSPDAASGAAPDDAPDAAPVDAPVDAPVEETPAEPSLIVDDGPRPGEVGVVTVPPDAADDVVPVDVEPGTRLLVDADLCPTVGETLGLTVTAVEPSAEDGTPPATRDVTTDVQLTARFGEALELISRGDESIVLRMNEQDIAELVLDLAGESSRTVRIGGFGADAPADALMRKPVEGGCLYALRLGSTFCGTARSSGEGVGSFGTGDTVVALDGCDYEAPDGLPLIELAPSGERGE